MIARLWTSKVFWTAVAGLVTTLGLAATGEIQWLEAGKLAFVALTTMFFRDTLAGKGPGKYPKLPAG